MSGPMALSDCCGSSESLSIIACSGYQRKAIGEQGIENRSPKAKSSTPSTSIMFLLAAKIVRNKSLFEMQCTMHSALLGFLCISVRQDNGKPPSQPSSTSVRISSIAEFG